MADHKASRTRNWSWFVSGVVGVCLGVAASHFVTTHFGLSSDLPPAAVQDDHDGHDADGDGAEAHEGHEDEPGDAIHLPENQRLSAGVRIAVVQRGDLMQTTRVTGKVALNEDRVTRIHPLVEGRVHEVPIAFGDPVKKGQIVAVIDSQQVGRAKLELYKSQRETRLAQVNNDWHKTVYENTHELIDALREGIAITEIEKKFHNKPMGEYRDQLLSGYAELHKTGADYERLAEVTQKGIVAGKQMLAATAARDVARAKSAGDLEQIWFLAERDKIAAEQALEKARTTEAVNRELLVILGYKDIQDEDIDPVIQGEAISHYEVKAPFDGIVISKDVVLMDQVDPSTQMFSIADFSTVWVQADIYENYLRLVEALAGNTVWLHANAYPDRDFEATVFYTGNVIGEKTRTIDIRAIGENPNRLLKPGMFVEIELPGVVVPDVIQVPRTAIVAEKGEMFVFVEKSKEAFERRDVKVGRATSDVIEITEGLEPGEKVAVGGIFALKNAAQSEVTHVHVH